MRAYLGDSVYVDLELGQVKLTTENGIEKTNTIFLEPQVMDALIQWYKDLNGVKQL